MSSWWRFFFSLLVSFSDAFWQTASLAPQQKRNWRTQEKQQWMTVSYMLLHPLRASRNHETCALRRAGAVCFILLDAVTCVLIRHLCNSMTFTSLAPWTASQTVHLSIPLHEFPKKELMMDEATEVRPTELTQWMSDGLSLHTLT